MSRKIIYIKQQHPLPTRRSSDLKPWKESVALPDPNLYAARALAASLARKGVAVEGGAASTTDSLDYRTVRCCSQALDRKSTRLNSSHLSLSYLVSGFKKKRPILA